MKILAHLVQVAVAVSCKMLNARFSFGTLNDLVTHFEDLRGRANKKIFLNALSFEFFAFLQQEKIISFKISKRV